MTSSAPLHIATVGTGYFSRFQYEAWSRIPEVQLVGICNRTIEPAEELAALYDIRAVFQDFEKMLDEVKPDIVDIITPPSTHMAYVKACVIRNIPVICQKPFTPSLQDATELVDFIEAHEANVIIHENFRFQPWYLKIKNILEAGTLGKLYQVSFFLRPGDGQGPDAYLDRQPYFQQMDRFLIRETAIHLIDVFQYLFGDIRSVSADLRRINPAIKGEDAGIIIFDFEDGSRGLFDGNRLSDHNASNRRLTMGEMRIEGENGTLSLNGNADLFLRKHGENDDNVITYDWEDRDFGGDCVFNLQRHVVDHFLNGTVILNTAKEYLRSIEISEAIYVSSETGRRVNLDQQQMIP